MSAENMLTMRRMNNGQFWLINMATGDTVLECHGNSHVFAKCDTYEAARVKLDFVSCEEIEIGYVDRRTGESVWTGVLVYNDEYHYAEHGTEIPTLEALMREPPMLVSGMIILEFGGRPCGCVDERDISRHEWRVKEYCHETGETRVLGEGLRYARAMNLAHSHKSYSVGDMELSLPGYFRRFNDYENHYCHGDDQWSFEMSETDGE